jgi:VIT1/CCC1 family predicted Fe2+/Mn2+ transporter
LMCLLVFLSSFSSVLFCILFYLFLFGRCRGAWPVCVVFLFTFWFPYSFFL